MKRTICFLLLGCGAALPLRGQPDRPRGYQNFPIIITAQFHALSMPFRDLKANFANIGLGLGTEVSLNGKHNWVQQLSLVWYRNKTVGNGLMAYTQTVWRPTVTGHFFTEVKAGIGYQLAFRPVDSFRPVNGGWASVGRKGKGMPAVPVGLSVGYDNPASRTAVSPFATYQLLLISGYNKSVPLVPQTLIQAGARIHPNYGR
ncbi:hypothetical protein [Larkinella soli]|uniref:hypothetical protein n=1 Tax=Larkinella soli TaxID=1770527 RepID=UPI000FFB6366|nr:hypothetical protein [Larkinella soli]